MAQQMELKALKDWLKRDGNSTAYLAVNLGYKSSASITTWLARKRVPSRACKPLMDLLEKGDASK